MSVYVQGLSDLQAIADRLAATPAQVDRALRRTISATARWANRAGEQGIAAALGIRVGILRGRCHVYLQVKGDKVAKAWFGLNDITSASLNPQATATGARAEGIGDVPHGFVQSAGPGGRRYIFVRRGTARYPIDLVSLPIDEVGGTVLEGDVLPEVEVQLRTRFETELEREMSK